MNWLNSKGMGTMSVERDASVSSALLHAQTKYIESFPDKSRSLSTLLQEFVDAPKQAQSREALHYFLHKIAGSLGMYGYQSESLIARDAVDAALSSEADIVVERVKHLINSLDQIISSNEESGQ